MPSDSENCCLAGPFFLAVGGFLLYSSLMQYSLIGKIKNTPTSKVRGAAIGLIELHGKARMKTETMSPISKAKCAYWRLKCQYYQSGKNGGWRDFYNINSTSRFYLEDDTGKMLINAEGAEVEIPADFESQGAMDDKPILGFIKKTVLDRKVLDYLEANPEMKKRFERYKYTTVRVSESFIAEGDELFVLGDAMPIEGTHELVVAKKKDGVMYVNDSGEKKAISNLSTSFYLVLAIGVFMCMVGIYFSYSTVSALFGE